MHMSNDYKVAIPGEHSVMPINVHRYSVNGNGVLMELTEVVLQQSKATPFLSLSVSTK